MVIDGINNNIRSMVLTTKLDDRIMLHTEVNLNLG